MPTPIDTPSSTPAKASHEPRWDCYRTLVSNGPGGTPAACAGGPVNPVNMTCGACGHVEKCIQCRGSVAFGKCTICGYVLNARQAEARPPILELDWGRKLPDLLPDLLTHEGYLHDQEDYWKSVASEMSNTYENWIKEALNGDEQSQGELLRFRLRQHRHYPYVNEDGKMVIGERHKVFDRADLAIACAALGDVGYDEMRYRTSAREGVGDSKGDWTPVDDRVAADLKYRIYEQCVWETMKKDGTGWDYSPVLVSKNVLQETIDGRCKRNRFDRLRDYYDKCLRKHKDVDEDYCRTLIESCFYIDDPDMAAEASEYILQTPVLRSRDAGGKADILPILFSRAQGAGKSTFVRLLLPPDLEMTQDNVDFNANATDFAHAIDGKAVCEIPELQGIRGAALGKIKSHLSRQEDNARRKYERYAITTRRRCVFIATENRSGMVPDDPSGSRRFVVVRVRRRFSYAEMVTFLNENRDRFWASIQKRLARKLADGTGEELFLDGMAKRQTAVNEEHRDSNEVVESLIVEFVEDRTKPYRLIDVLRLMYPDQQTEQNKKENQKSAKKAIENFGWQYRKDSAGKRMWHPPECECAHAACKKNRTPKGDGSYAGHRAAQAQAAAAGEIDLTAEDLDTPTWDQCSNCSNQRRAGSKLCAKCLGFEGLTPAAAEARALRN